MPYLQLDVNDSYPVDLKGRLAARMCETYASMMSVDIRRISVAIRELGAGGVWRIAEVGEVPVPVALLMLDIRQADIGSDERYRPLAAAVRVRG